MQKHLTIHDLLKSGKRRPIPTQPRREKPAPPEQGTVRLQIEVPCKVFEHFRGKDVVGGKRKSRDTLSELLRNNMPEKGKVIHFDSETYTALRQLADDRMASFQELADEAFALLLKKYGRPVGIKAQLKASVMDRRKKRHGDRPKAI